jgi:hypothetical protein
VRFRFLTVASMKMIAFWDVVPSSLEVGRRFRGVCCLHHQAISCFLLPDDMENHGWIISTKGKSWFVHQSSWTILPAESSSSKQEGQVKEMMNLALRSIFVCTFQVIFTCHKILWHGANNFTSPTKEDTLWIFIALKNPSSWLGFDLRIWVQWQAL